MKRVLTAGKISTVDGRRVFRQVAVLTDGNAVSAGDCRQYWERSFGLPFLARCFRIREQRTIAGR
jgi:hypothetical protein